MPIKKRERGTQSVWHAVTMPNTNAVNDRVTNIQIIIFGGILNSYP
jgi:hypothetical protein